MFLFYRLFRKISKDLDRNRILKKLMSHTYLTSDDVLEEGEEEGAEDDLTLHKIMFYEKKSMHMKFVSR